MEPAIEARLICKFHLLYPPSSATGPHPEPVQISGHGILVLVSAPEGVPVVVHNLGFVVDNRHSTRVAGVVMNDPLTMIPDPQIRVWLDEPAHMAPGPVPLALPITVPEGHSEIFRLTAHTGKNDVQWRLGIEWTCRDKRSWAHLEIRTTAETGMVSYHPDGRRTSQANLHREPDRPEVAAEAESNYRRAAEGGDTEAMFHLGVSLAERGELTEAEQWFRACAESGHPRAAESVGWILEQNGHHTEAATWYRKAADLGSARAARRLARQTGYDCSIEPRE